MDCSNISLSKLPRDEKPIFTPRENDTIFTAQLQSHQITESHPEPRAFIEQYNHRMMHLSNINQSML